MDSLPESSTSIPFAQGVSEPFHFGEEIRGFSSENHLDSSSFTALLGLQSSEALVLLHPPISGQNISGKGNSGQNYSTVLNHGEVSTTLPANASLVERAAKYSVFATKAESDIAPGSFSIESNSGDTSGKFAGDSDSQSKEGSYVAVDDRTVTICSREKQTMKRKEADQLKAFERLLQVKAGTKKSKGDVENGRVAGSDENVTRSPEKPAYVHVRARRGQATDSHSLAERARREKINARMKLLQELVPGCNKISGTALVLDEIINHVQYLQRQVEFLSMRLAAVHPRVVDFNFDSFLSSEPFQPFSLGLTASNGVMAARAEEPAWSPVQVNGVQRPWPTATCANQYEGTHSFSVPQNPPPSLANSGTPSLRPNQLKMEL
ncbi:hypothetical protein AMTRI_Chr03g44950 [Amborella trichopoda]